jgi:hypothetical protein
LTGTCSDPETAQNKKDETKTQSLTPEQLAEIFGHCAQPGIIRFPYQLEEIADEGQLEYPPKERKYEKTEDGNDIVPFEYAEHCWLGDSLRLQGHDSEADKTARMNPFKLENGLQVTYGQINGLAGDFFGTYDPICDGSSAKEQQKRFRAAHDSLAKRPLDKFKAHQVLKLLQKESKAILDAYEAKAQPISDEYKKIPDETVQFQLWTTIGSGPSYLRLAAMNLDHFGADARKAYNAGHAAALEEASRKNLQLAYTMNAFADHFLEDSFASGHFRTPRRKLFENISNLLGVSLQSLTDIKDKNLCAKVCIFGASLPNTPHSKS